MTQPDAPILLDLDPSGYIQGLGQADQATDRFGTTLRTTAVAMGPLRQAMNNVTPTRAVLGSMTAFTTLAARQQQQLSGLAASSAVTGTNFGRLTGGMRQLAREMPVGNHGAREMVTTLSKLGVVSGGTEKPLNAVSKSVAAFNKTTLSGAGPGSGLQKMADRFDEAFGTRGKMTSSGAEKRINDLSRSFMKLGGATSEAPATLAANVVQLNRAMGTGLNVQRVERMNDSLTSLSASSGSSATGILQFSKAIAPMAQASGLGQTQVLGISAAFSKLGDEGYGAATAFNKMLGDMHRSVREGTPQMAAYAQIVGKTTGEFQELFKANPGEAMTQVVEAIGKSGNAPRQLEQLGLDGVRTARYLTNLAQSGDLRGSIATAVGSYGNGATERASEVAFGGLNDSLTRMATNAEQTATAMGTPLLGAVTMFTDVLGASLTPLRAIAESGPIQTALTAATYTALPLLAGLKLIGPALNAAGIFQMVSSGPVRGLLGGFAASGAPGRRLAGRLGGDRFNERVAEGLPVGRGRMEGVNQRAAVLGAGVGRALQGSVIGTGPGVLRQAGGGLVAGMAVTAQMMAEQLRMARIPFAEREGRYRPPGAGYEQFRDREQALRGDVRAGIIGRGEYVQQTAQAFRSLTDTVGTTRNALLTLGRGALAVSGQGLATGAVMAGRGLMRGGAALAGAFGGPVGLGLTALTAGAMLKSGTSSRREEMLDAQRNATSWIDDYRVAMGKATDATTTFAGRLDEAAKAATNAPVSAQGAREVSQSEMDRALASRAPAVRNYGSDPRVAANMLRLQAGTSGIAPDEMQRVQQDLFKGGMGLEQVREVMKQLPSSLKPGRGSSVNDIRAVVGDIARAPGDAGFLNWRNTLDPTLMMNEGTKASNPLGISNLSKDQKRGAEDLTVSIRDRAAATSSTYGAEYATAQMLKEMDAAIDQAMKSGNVDLQRNLTERFQAELGLDKTFGISTADLKRSGGFSGVMAQEDRGFREGAFATAQSARANPETKESWASEQIGSGNFMSRWFSTKGNSSIQRSIQGLIGPNGNPESPSLQVSTLQDAMRTARAAGTSMEELAARATEAANSLGSVADSSVALAIRNQALAQMGREANYQSTSEGAMARGRQFAADAAISPSSPETQQIQEQGVAGLQQLEQEAASRVKARLTQQREFQVQTTRMGEDFRQQAAWSEQDYQRGVSRSSSDFHRSMLRGEQDFGITRVRTARQHTRGIARAEQDFRISVADSTSDFYRQRLYGQRDFNKSIRRAAEDGAKAMYDPYQRIQVKPTWDAQNLLGNMREQNAAIETQMANLSKLRRGGVGNNAIKLLGLNDPNNAQQLAQIVADMANSPQVAQQLNRAASQRKSLGMALAKDPGNTDLARAREDFTEQSKRTESEFKLGMRRQGRAFRMQLNRAEEDYRTASSDMSADHRRAVNRATEDNRRGMARAAEDRGVALGRTQRQYAIAVRRMREDVKRADQEIVGSLKDLTTAMNRAVRGQFVNFQDITKDGMKGWNDVLKRHQTDFKSLVLGMGTELKITVEQQGTASFSALRGDRVDAGGNSGRGGDGMGWQRQIAAVREVFPGARLHSGYRPGAITATGNPSYHGMGRAVDIPPSMAIFNWIRNNYPNSRELIFTPAGRRQINNGRDYNYPNPRTKRDHYDHVHWAMQKGGVATKPTKTLISEAGFNEAIVPLNMGGAQMMADALRRWVKLEDVQGMKAASGVTYITYDSSTTTHDNRVIIEHVDLKADTPRQLAEAAAARSRANNLTAPMQRRK